MLLNTTLSHFACLLLEFEWILALTWKYIFKRTVNNLLL